jgi:hypothetical protein
MSYGDYVAGAGLVLAAVLPLALGAAALRARVLPTWTGCSARVAEAVIVLSGLLLAAEVSRCLSRSGLVARRTLTPGSAPYSARKVPLPGTGQAIVYAFASRSTAAREEDGIATFFSAGSGRTERFGSVIVGYVAPVSDSERTLVERCL